MTDKQLLKQALETQRYALACLLNQLSTKDKHAYAVEKLDASITAIRARLEQPEEKYTYGTPLLDAFTNPPAQPAPAQREHITDGSQCWCEPETDYIDPETGAAVIVHKEPQ
jgi:hypothetical protein